MNKEKLLDLLEELDYAIKATTEDKDNLYQIEEVAEQLKSEIESGD